MSKNTEVNNKIVINQGGDDRIVLEQLSNGVFKAKEIVHNCKTVELGVNYLLKEKKHIKQMIKEYNTECEDEQIQ